MPPVYDINDAVRFDVDAIRVGVQKIVAARSITTDAGWAAFIDARPMTGGTAGPLSSNPSMETLLRAFFKTLIKIEQ